MNRKIIFIIGGARSGKSTYALKEASNIPDDKVYIATAEALDEEMRQKIENHRRQRGVDWVTYEEPLRISEVIKEIEGKYSVIVIDCLTLWLSNLMIAHIDIVQEIENLVEALKDPTSITHNSLLLIVSNEVGMGIVPENEMARKFRDVAGFLNQRIAEIANEVYLMVSGIPLKVKG